MTDKKAPRGARYAAPIEISPEDLAEIDSILSDTKDPTIERQFRRRLMAEAYDRAAWRRRREDAYTEAVARGYAAPEAYARSVASGAAVIDRHNRQVEWHLKKAETENRERRQKVALQHERPSKTAKPKSRRLPVSDAKYLDILGKAEKAGYINDTALVVSDIKKSLNTYKPPHWDKTTAALKVLAMSVQCHQRGSRTINLQVNDDVCRKAMASSRGPASYMQDAIRRSLIKSFGKGMAPDFLIVIETTTRDRHKAKDTPLSSFHVHGLVVMPDHPHAEELIDEALREAGGEWQAHGGQQYQQFGKPLTDPYVWAAYMMKDVLGTQRHIDRKLFARSAGLFSSARSSWDDLRKSLPQTA